MNLDADAISHLHLVWAFSMIVKLRADLRILLYSFRAAAARGRLDPSCHQVPASRCLQPVPKY